MGVQGYRCDNGQNARYKCGAERAGRWVSRVSKARVGHNTVSVRVNNSD